MHRILFALSLVAWSSAGQAAEWRVSHVNAPARVSAIETVAGQAQINAGGLWYKIVLAGDKISLAFIDPPATPKPALGSPSRPRATTTASSATSSRPAPW
jgi:hypothetical protein